jgi:hypothetical protein
MYHQVIAFLLNDCSDAPGAADKDTGTGKVMPVRILQR